MRLKLLIGIPLALAIAVVGGSWIYIKVLSDDPPAKLTVDSSSSRTTAASGAAVDDGTTDGTWKASAASVVGYRVKETLFGASNEATGRASKITGAVAISGTSVVEANFTVDMTTISSDKAQRDGQFQGRIMNTSQFPTATFKLIAPIKLTSVALDEPATTKATGNLMLHGVTKKVTFDITAKRLTGQIRASGAIPVHFADYDINNPSGGPASVGDDGTLEFTLVFTR